MGWKGGSLYDVGLDVLIDLKTACFIDRVVIAQDAASSSAFAGVTALVSCDGKRSAPPAVSIRAFAA